MTRLTGTSVSTPISAFGVLGALLILAMAVDDHRAGASPLGVVAATALFLVAFLALVRDVRAGRRAAVRETG
ncbi:hypothetical protein [Streptomyces pini]|uniref:hypothetical protein n=1 Tax=Streptomyces pini TaxID=1520580 RepID=UPI000B818086|nr:hypothetical protein [Streptomyces pini]